MRPEREIFAVLATESATVNAIPIRQTKEQENTVVKDFENAISLREIERAIKIAKVAAKLSFETRSELVKCLLLAADSITEENLIKLAHILGQDLDILFMFFTHAQSGTSTKWMRVACILLNTAPVYRILQRRWDDALAIVKKIPEILMIHPNYAELIEAVLHMRKSGTMPSDAELNLFRELIQLGQVDVLSLLCELPFNPQDPSSAAYASILWNSEDSRLMQIKENLTTILEKINNATDPNAIWDVIYNGWKECSAENECSKKIIMKYLQGHLHKYAKNAILRLIANDPSIELDQKTKIALNQQRNAYSVFNTTTRSTTLYHALKKGDPNASVKLNAEIKANNDVLSLFVPSVPKNQLVPVRAILVKNTNLKVATHPIVSAVEVATLHDMEDTAPRITARPYARMPHLTPPIRDFKEEICNSLTSRELMQLVTELKNTKPNELKGLLKLAKNKLLCFALEGQLTTFDRDTLDFIKERRVTGFRGGFLQTTSDKILDLIRNRKDNEAGKLLREEIKSNKSEFKKPSPAIDELENYVAQQFQDMSARGPILSSLGEVTPRSRVVAPQPRSPSAPQRTQAIRPVATQVVVQATPLQESDFPKVPTNLPKFMTSIFRKKTTTTTTNDHEVGMPIMGL